MYCIDKDVDAVPVRTGATLAPDSSFSQSWTSRTQQSNDLHAPGTALEVLSYVQARCDSGGIHCLLGYRLLKASPKPSVAMLPTIAQSDTYLEALIIMSIRMMRDRSDLRPHPFYDHL